MTKSSINPTTSTKPASHIAYHIRESKNGSKAYWTRIGIAWAHADGNGFNIQVHTVPLDGRIGLRTLSEKPE